ncbi:unnamed protein product [Rotaria sp. Silwood1]|nr:unnamed protein product [Rotaria sp. Silwood1]CAF3489522.1 unnamed protein product [Rotaria sp. Silwood1]CAF3549117.1 unnamed protein product [Rotaria sp. Silwood1]
MTSTTTTKEELSTTQLKDAIRRYTKQSFVFKLINKALQTKDNELLHKFGFFIDRAWIEYNIDRVLALKEEWKKKTREYEDRAYDQMMNNKSARTKDSAHVLNNIGLILYRQGKFDETIDCHQRALKIREKLYPFVHADMAKSLGNIGNILSDQRKYNEALDNHQHALKIEEKFHPFGHVDIAHIIDL